jgi:hypothetical protein
MKRTDLLKLRLARWEKLFAGTPAEIEVKIVPSEMPSMMGGFLGISTAQIVDRIVERAWIDFRGYEDEHGNPIPNTVDERRELYTTVPNFRDALNNTLQAVNNELMLGEDNSGSDSVTSESPS